MPAKKSVGFAGVPDEPKKQAKSLDDLGPAPTPITRKARSHTFKNPSQALQQKTLEQEKKKQKQVIQLAAEQGRALVKQIDDQKNMLLEKEEEIQEKEREITEISSKLAAANREQNSFEQRKNMMTNLLLDTEKCLVTLVEDGADTETIVEIIGKERIAQFPELAKACQGKGGRRLAAKHSMRSLYDPDEEADKLEYEQRMMEMEQLRDQAEEMELANEELMADLEGALEEVLLYKGMTEELESQQADTVKTYDQMIDDNFKQIQTLEEAGIKKDEEVEFLKVELMTQKQDLIASRQKRSEAVAKLEEQRTRLEFTTEQQKEEILDLKTAVARHLKDKQEREAAILEEKFTLQEELQSQIDSKIAIISNLETDRAQKVNQIRDLVSELNEEQECADGLVCELDAIKEHLAALEIYAKDVTARLEDADQTCRQRDTALVACRDIIGELNAGFIEQQENQAAMIVDFKAREQEWSNLLSKAKRDNLALEEELIEMKKFKDEAHSLKKDLKIKQEHMERQQQDFETQLKQESSRQQDVVHVEQDRYNKLLADQEQYQNEVKSKMQKQVREKQEAERKASEAARAVEDTTQTLKLTEEEKANLEEKLEALSKQHDTLVHCKTEEDDESRRKLEDLERQIAKWKSEAKRLEALLDSERQNVAETIRCTDEEKRMEKQKFSVDIEEAEEQRIILTENLTNERKMRSTAEATVREEKSRGDKLQTELSESKKVVCSKELEIQGLTSQLKQRAEQKDQMKREMEDVEATLLREQKEKMDLERFYRTQGDERERSYRTKAAEEAKKWNNQVVSLKTEIKTVKMQHDEDVQRLQRELKDKSNLATLNKEALDDVQNELEAKTREMNHVLEDERQQRHDIADRLKSEQEKCSKIQIEMQRLQREATHDRDRLAAEVSELHTKLEAAENTSGFEDPAVAQELTHKISSLKLDLDSAKDENIAMQHENKRIKERIREEMANGQRKVIEATARLEKDKLETETKLKDQIYELKRELDHAQASVVNVDTKSNESIRSLTTQLTTATSENKKLMQQMESYKRRLIDLEKEEQERAEERTRDSKARLDQYDYEQKQQELIDKLEGETHTLTLKHLEDVQKLERELNAERTASNEAAAQHRENQQRLLNKIKELNGLLGHSQMQESELLKTKQHLDHYQRQLELERRERTEIEHRHKIQKVEDTHKFQQLVARERKLREDILKKSSPSEITEQLQNELNNERSRVSDLERQLEQQIQLCSEKIRSINRERDEESLTHKSDQDRHVKEVQRLQQLLESEKLQMAEINQRQEEQLRTIERDMMSQVSNKEESRQRIAQDLIMVHRTEMEKLRGMLDREKQEREHERTRHKDELKRLQMQLMTTIESKEEAKNRRSENFIRSLERQRQQASEMAMLKSEIESERATRNSKEREYVDRETKLYQQLQDLLNSDEGKDTFLSEHKAQMEDMKKMQREIELERQQRAANDRMHHDQQQQLFAKLLNVLKSDDGSHEQLVQGQYQAQITDMMKEIDRLQTEITVARRQGSEAESTRIRHEEQLFQKLLESVNEVKEANSRAASPNAASPSSFTEETRYIHELQRLQHEIETERTTHRRDHQEWMDEEQKRMQRFLNMMDFQPKTVTPLSHHHSAASSAAGTPIPNSGGVHSIHTFHTTTTTGGGGGIVPPVLVSNLPPSPPPRAISPMVAVSPFAPSPPITIIRPLTPVGSPGSPHLGASGPLLTNALWSSSPRKYTSHSGASNELAAQLKQVEELEKRLAAARSGSPLVTGTTTTTNSRTSVLTGGAEPLRSPSPSYATKSFLPYSRGASVGASSPRHIVAPTHSAGSRSVSPDTRVPGNTTKWAVAETRIQTESALSRP